MSNTTPIPSDQIPKYVQDGIDRQDISTLLDIASYCEELAEHKHREEVSEEDIEKEGVEEITSLDEDIDIEKLLDEGDDLEAARGGSVVVRRVKCGSDCTCNSGRGHGPYAYLVWYDEGKQHWKYVGPA